MNNFDELSAIWRSQSVNLDRVGTPEAVRSTLQRLSKQRESTLRWGVAMVVLVLVVVQIVSTLNLIAAKGGAPTTFKVAFLVLHQAIYLLLLVYVFRRLRGNRLLRQSAGASTRDNLRVALGVTTSEMRDIRIFAGVGILTQVLLPIVSLFNSEQSLTASAMFMRGSSFVIAYIIVGVVSWFYYKRLGQQRRNLTSLLDDLEAV